MGGGGGALWSRSEKFLNIQEKRNLVKRSYYLIIVKYLSKTS